MYMCVIFIISEFLYLHCKLFKKKFKFKLRHKIFLICIWAKRFS